MRKHTELFDKLRKDKEFLICAHRGTFGGGIIENTLSSFNLALNLGADIIEMDVIRSTDDVIYVFHDTEEPRAFGVSQNIKTFSSGEINELNYINRYGMKTNKKVETLEYVLKSLKNQPIINIDRCYRDKNLFLEVIKIIKRLDMLNQVIIKAPPTAEFMSWIEETDRSFMFMPIVTQVNQVEYCENRGLNIIGLELVFKTLDNPLLNKELHKKWLNLDYVLWCNSLTIDVNYPLAAGYDDEISLTENYDSGWGKLLELGFNIIQTDWVKELKQYRETRGI